MTYAHAQTSCSHEGFIERDDHDRRYCTNCGAIVSDYEAAVCDTCGVALDPFKGDVFLTDDGGLYCNDHYPDND